MKSSEALEGVVKIPRKFFVSGHELIPWVKVKVMIMHTYTSLLTLLLAECVKIKALEVLIGFGFMLKRSTQIWNIEAEQSHFKKKFFPLNSYYKDSQCRLHVHIISTNKSNFFLKVSVLCECLICNWHLVQNPNK